MKKISIVILLLLIGVFSAYSQGKGKSKKTNSKYRIEFTINGVHDTVIYVGHHLGEKKYVIDTIALDANGYGVMEGNKHLYKGIYIVVLPSRNMNFFEFLMPDENERHFSLTNDITNLTMNLKVKNSPTNQAFSEYQRGMSEYSTERVEIDKMFKDAGEDTAARNKA